MSYSKGDVILLPYPFTDLKAQKVRPAVVVSCDKEKYDDIFVVPLTSKINNISGSEFCIINWKEAGLNVPTAVKRGCVLIDVNLIIKRVGILSEVNIKLIDDALKKWFDLK